MKLNFQIYPTGLTTDQINEHPVIIIPGLFGSISNWRGFAKTLASDFPVIVIDQRNHGGSPHADSNTYFDMANDLLELIDEHGFEKVILCGHSMGGKTAMVFSLLHPTRVDKLAVLDIAPVVYKHSHAPFLKALLEINLSELASRSAADRALQTAIPDTNTRLFLLQNLVGSPNSYRWRINIPVLLHEMHTIGGFPVSELEQRTNSAKALIINGELSDFVLPEHHKVIRNFFPSVCFDSVFNAGHWLHIEQPQAVISSLIKFFKK